MNVFIQTFGCTHNHADADGMKEKLVAAGHTLSTKEKADVVILNTCAVKDATEQKQLHQIRNTRQKLVVTGCLAQTSPNLVQKNNPAAALVGTFSQNRIVDAVQIVGEQPIRLLGREKPLENAARTEGVVGRIKISRGCLSACSFCQTKIARGHLQSFPVSELRRVAREQLRLGAVELQLTSQDCGCYGFDQNTNAAKLLDALSGLGGGYRIRLGMGNPEHVRRYFDDLLDALAHENAYQFLHVPVQSGSDSVLNDMKRPYTAALFEELATRFRQRFPSGMLATDVIVGFPTETEADFQQTLELLERTQPEVVNVSKYSARPNTPAASLPQIDNTEIKRRSRVCSELCQRLAQESHERLVGYTQEVTAIEPAKNGVLCRSKDYRPVILPNATIGKTYTVQIQSAGSAYLKAVVETPVTARFALHA